MAKKRDLSVPQKTLMESLVGGDDVDSAEASALALEFLQASMLHSVFTNDLRNIFLAKGGMAMLMMGAGRRTQDIDLAADPAVPITTIANHMRNAIRTSLASTGLLLEPTVREKDIGGGGLSPKWFINGLLPGGTQVHLKIEISRRDKIPESGTKKVRYNPDSKFGINGYVAKTYSEPYMAASKVSALLDVKRVQPRDIYDLYVLIVTMEVKPPIALLAAVGKDEIKRMQNILWNKLYEMPWDEFNSKVIPALPENKREITEADYDTMRLTVAEHVEAWLEAAETIAQERIPRGELADHIDEIEKKAAELPIIRNRM